MSRPIILVENLSKQYSIGARREAYGTFRESLARAAVAPFKRIRNTVQQAFSGPARKQSQPDNNTFWALKDVSFQLQPGEVTGIIGRNGAGKSTLLKVLSQITEPTVGRVELYGRIASLLEVGTGFHPELTGRENVYLNGAVLGMSRREIRQKFDEIVSFSGVEQFLETPIKRYSSGMQVRLAFSVAAHLEPEILIVDEVLAVGDAEFQRRCLGKMDDIAHSGRTVLFVSHNMGAVQRLCSRGICLDRGRVVADGGIDRTIKHYMEAQFQDTPSETRLGSGPLFIEKVVLKNSHGEVASQFAPGDELTINVAFRAANRIPSPMFWFAIESQYGSLCGASMLLDGKSPDSIEGDGQLSCIFRSLPFMPQEYVVSMGVRAADGVTILSPTNQCAAFNIIGQLRDYGLASPFADSLSSSCAPALFPYEWKLPDGTRTAVSEFAPTKPQK